MCNQSKFTSLKKNYIVCSVQCNDTYIYIGTKKNKYKYIYIYIGRPIRLIKLFNKPKSNLFNLINF